MRDSGWRRAGRGVGIMGRTPPFPTRGSQVHRLLAFAALAALPAAAACPALLDHRMSSIKGEPADLCGYAGKVVLVVNTASYCGYTGQYKGLEALYQRFRSRGAADFQNKLLSAMRYQFGGHHEKPADK